MDDDRDESDLEAEDEYEQEKAIQR